MSSWSESFKKRVEDIGAAMRRSQSEEVRCADESHCTAKHAFGVFQWVPIHVSAETSRRNPRSAA
jgi:hypothetical protein